MPCRLAGLVGKPQRGLVGDDRIDRPSRATIVINQLRSRALSRHARLYRPRVLRLDKPIDRSAAVFGDGIAEFVNRRQTERRNPRRRLNRLLNAGLRAFDAEPVENAVHRILRRHHLG